MNKSQSVVFIAVEEIGSITYFLPLPTSKAVQARNAPQLIKAKQGPEATTGSPW
jgi:hypothetical protein